MSKDSVFPVCGIFIQNNKKELQKRLRVWKGKKERIDKERFLNLNTYSYWIFKHLCSGTCWAEVADMSPWLWTGVLHTTSGAMTHYQLLKSCDTASALACERPATYADLWVIFKFCWSVSDLQMLLTCERSSTSADLWHNCNFCWSVT